MIIINFKNYKTGKDVLKLAKICKAVSKKNMMIALSAADIYPVSRFYKQVLAQHVDFNEKGAFTGAVLPEAVKENGAVGTLLNHAERKLSFNVLKKTILRCKEVKLKTIVCAASIKQAKEISKLKPDYIAFEDPTLIGTGKSISKVKASKVKKFAKIIRKTGVIPLCGAGVSTRADMKAALELGTKGILISSAIVKSKKPRRSLINLTKS